MFDEGYERWRASTKHLELFGDGLPAEAVSDASSRQDLFPDLASARFVAADAADTGLPAECADAVVSIDVLQLVPDPAAMAREITRLVKPGGRVVVTTWEASGDMPERFPRDIPGLFAGLSDVEVHERPEWLPRQWAIYDAAIEADDGSDPAIADLATEGHASLAWRSDVRRLVVTASRR